MQPVAVEQVAATFVKALDLPETVGSTYLLGGGASYSYDEILDITGLAQGKDKVAKMHQPLFLLRPMIKMLQGSEYFPITNDQLTMLLEGNVCDTKNWVKTFGIEPLSYADGIGACFRSNP
jgi:NADH dehydrogenase